MCLPRVYDMHTDMKRRWMDVWRERNVVDLIKNYFGARFVKAAKGSLSCSPRVTMGVIDAPKPVEETFLWQLFHSVFFLIGGFTFIFGTGLHSQIGRIRFCGAEFSTPSAPAVSWAST